MIVLIMIIGYQFDSFDRKTSYFITSLQLLCYNIIYTISFLFKEKRDCKITFISICKEMVMNLWIIICHNIMLLIILFPIHIFVKLYLYRLLKNEKQRKPATLNTQEDNA